MYNSGTADVRPAVEFGLSGLGELNPSLVNVTLGLVDRLVGERHGGVIRVTGEGDARRFEPPGGTARTRPPRTSAP